MLKDKVIIVTGGGRGIGKACAELFAEDGAKVLISDILVEDAEETVAGIVAKGGQAAWIKGDMSSESDVMAMVDKAVETFGRLDGAVNNAGVAMYGAPIRDLPIEGWSKVIGINLTGVYLCTKYESRAMMASGGGAIVNISSADGLIGRPDAADYNASKHGVIGLTKSASTEYRESRVRVNAVLPGLTWTPLIESLLDDPSYGPQVAGIAARHTIDRKGLPLDIAEACRWLLSDHSTFINGVSLPVDGGYVAR